MTEVTGQFQAQAAVPFGKVRTEQETAWPSEPVWTLWRSEKSLTLAWNRTPNPKRNTPPTQNSVYIPDTKLYMNAKTGLGEGI